MKNKTLLLLLLCAIPVAALREGGHRTTDGSAVTGTAYLVPQIDYDFSDLDVRDAQNRPIRAPEAKEQLEALFRESLLNLTVFAIPHAVAQTEDWLNQFSHLFNKWIYTRCVVVLGLFQEAFFPPEKRFVHNVYNLCTTLFAALCLSLALFRTRPIASPPLRVSLRC